MKHSKLFRSTSIVIPLALLAVVFAMNLIGSTSASKSLKATSYSPPTLPRFTQAVRPTCGSWGTTSTSRTKSAVDEIAGPSEKMYQCGFSGRSWVVGYESTSNGNPSIAVYGCRDSDSNCLSSTTNHPVGNWKKAVAPYPGSMTLIGNPYPGLLVLDVGGHQILFDTTNGEWLTTPPSNMGDCSHQWGSNFSGPPALASQSDQMRYMKSNLSCA